MTQELHDWTRMMAAEFNKLEAKVLRLENYIKYKFNVGIYMIVCLVTLDIYIGSAVDLKRRKRTHWSQARKGTHHSEKFQEAWDEHGEEQFVFVPLESVEPAALQFREQWYLDQFYMDQLYNMTKNAIAFRRGTYNTLEHNRKVSAALRRSNIDHEPIEPLKSNYGENNGKSKLKRGEVILIKRLLESDLTETEIAAMFNVSQPTISMIRTRQRWGWLD